MITEFEEINMMSDSLEDIFRTSPLKKNVVAFLRVKGVDFPIYSGINTLGRDRRNDITLDDMAVSKFHARIDVDDGFHLLRDTGSQNQTKINQETCKAWKYYHVEDQERITFGDIPSVYTILNCRSNITADRSRAVKEDTAGTSKEVDEILMDTQSLVEISTIESSQPSENSDWKPKLKTCNVVDNQIIRIGQMIQKNEIHQPDKIIANDNKEQQETTSSASVGYCIDPNKFEYEDFEVGISNEILSLSVPETQPGKSSADPPVIVLDDSDESLSDSSILGSSEIGSLSPGTAAIILSDSSASETENNKKENEIKKPDLSVQVPQSPELINKPSSHNGQEESPGENESECHKQLDKLPSVSVKVIPCGFVSDIYDCTTQFIDGQTDSVNMQKYIFDAPTQLLDTPCEKHIDKFEKTSHESSDVVAHNPVATPKVDDNFEAEIQVVSSDNMTSFEKIELTKNVLFALQTDDMNKVKKTCGDEGKVKQDHEGPSRVDDIFMAETQLLDDISLVENTQLTTEIGHPLKKEGISLKAETCESSHNSQRDPDETCVVDEGNSNMTEKSCDEASCNGQEEVDDVLEEELFSDSDNSVSPLEHTRNPGGIGYIVNNKLFSVDSASEANDIFEAETQVVSNNNMSTIENVEIPIKTEPPKNVLFVLPADDRDKKTCGDEESLELSHNVEENPLEANIIQEISDESSLDIQQSHDRTNELVDIFEAETQVLSNVSSMDWPKIPGKFGHLMHKGLLSVKAIDFDVLKSRGESSLDAEENPDEGSKPIDFFLASTQILSRKEESLTDHMQKSIISTRNVENSNKIEKTDDDSSPSGEHETVGDDFFIAETQVLLEDEHSKIPGKLDQSINIELISKTSDEANHDDEQDPDQCKEVPSELNDNFFTAQTQVHLEDSILISGSKIKNTCGESSSDPPDTAGNQLSIHDKKNSGASVKKVIDERSDSFTDVIYDTTQADSVDGEITTTTENETSYSLITPSSKSHKSNALPQKSPKLNKKKADTDVSPSSLTDVDTTSPSSYSITGKRHSKPTWKIQDNLEQSFMKTYKKRKSENQDIPGSPETVVGEVVHAEPQCDASNYIYDCCFRCERRRFEISKQLSADTVLELSKNELSKSKEYDKMDEHTEEASGSGINTDKLPSPTIKKKRGRSKSSDRGSSKRMKKASAESSQQQRSRNSDTENLSSEKTSSKTCRQWRSMSYVGQTSTSENASRESCGRGRSKSASRGASKSEEASSESCGRGRSKSASRGASKSEKASSESCGRGRSKSSSRGALTSEKASRESCERGRSKSASRGASKSETASKETSRQQKSKNSARQTSTSKSNNGISVGALITDKDLKGTDEKCKRKHDDGNEQDVQQTKHLKRSGRLYQKQEQSLEQETERVSFGTKARVYSPVPSLQVAKKLPQNPTQTGKGQKLKYHILFTGIQCTVRDSGVIKNLGGTVVDSPHECSVLITDKVRRTYKFLCAMALGKPIVNSQWLQKSRGSGYFLDPWKHLIKDPESEQRYSFDLQTSLRKACGQKLLLGYNVLVTPSVQPPQEEIKVIIEACGGKVLNQIPGSRWPKNSFIISCKEDEEYWLKVHKGKKLIVSVEALLRGILQQDLDLNAHVLT